MAKVLALTCDIRRLSDVNNLLRAHGHTVRGADCRSTMRDLLASEPFQYIASSSSIISRQRFGTP